METHTIPLVIRGDYILEIVALETSGPLHIYLSSEEGGPQALKTTNTLWLKPQRKKRLTVKWHSRYLKKTNTIGQDQAD